jgi:DNA-binding SARP family transcriptional activator
MSLCVNTLGGLSATRGGAPLSGAAAQPRRLAVLALLARAGDRGVTREKILALLWPDADEERGRKLLTQALYTLRRDLGDEDAIVGLKELRLNPERATSDVTAFEAAVRAGTFDRAAAVYGGAFLDGFHLPSSPEFEQWAERERTALAHEYQAALERLARQAAEAGDRPAAAGWWKRLAAQDPLNARYTAGLMQALADAGDVGGAIRQAQIYEALIEQELDLPPDQSVVALARRLRAASVPAVPTEAVPVVPVAPAPPSASQPVPAAVQPQVISTAVAPPSEAPSPEAPTSQASSAPAVPLPPPPPPRPAADSPIGHGRQRPWVGAAVGAALVLLGAAAWVTSGRRAAADPEPEVPGLLAVGRISDYRGAARTDGDLGLPLAEMLATNLARAPGLRVLSAARVYEVTRQLGAAGDTAAGALAGAARHAGAAELVDGALYAVAGGRLRLDLRRVDLATGQVRSAHSVDGPDAFALVDSGTARLVAGFGVRAPAGSIAEVTTRSLAAYRLYEEGLRAYHRGDAAAAAPLFDAALREDSTFAMAALYNAWSLPAQLRRSTDLMERAVRLADRVTDRERLIIRAGAALTSSSPTLAATADTLATRYPDEVEGHLYRGLGLMSAGRFTEAVAPLERVLAMDSLALTRRQARCSACRALQTLQYAYELADSVAASERLARRWIRLAPESRDGWVALAGVLARTDRAEAADSALRAASARAAASELDLNFAALLRLYASDVGGAERLLRGQLDAGGARRRDALWTLAVTLRHGGRMGEALEMARRYRREQPANPGAPAYSAHPNAAVPEAQALLEAGRPREAAALFDSIARWQMPGLDAAWHARHRAWHLTHTADALAMAGDTARLRALVDSVREHGARSGLQRDRQLHHHVRGLLLSAQGRDAEAVDAFRQAIVAPAYGYTRSNLALGTALLRLGRAPEAVAALQPVLRGWFDGSNLYVTHTEVHALLAEAWTRAGRADSAATHHRAVARAWAAGDPPFQARAVAAAAAAARVASGGVTPPRRPPAR